MSKALVIKGANFALNKVETIELSEPIPCIGLSVSPSTVLFTALDATQQLTVTKTPADTTDTVSYVSSNESVVTVSSSGLVTCVGVGSATITATCGTQTATCSITATIEIVLDDSYYAENGAKYSGSMELDHDPPKNHIGRAEDVRGRLYYQTTEYGKYRVFLSTANAGKYALPLPKGATKVTISPPTDLRAACWFIIANVNEKQTYVGGADGQSAIGIKPYNVPWNGSYPYIFDFSDYAESANGYIVSVLAPSGSEASQVTDKTTITFA